ncbi:hypothetical protein [Streptomyces aureocirculatus]|nr:hypothetical protein [Streptomyces aureocirculatus]
MGARPGSVTSPRSSATSTEPLVSPEVLAIALVVGASAGAVRTGGAGRD